MSLVCASVFLTPLAAIPSQVPSLLVGHAAQPHQLLQVFLHDGPFTELEEVSWFTRFSVDAPGLDDFLPVPGPAEKAKQFLLSLQDHVHVFVPEIARFLLENAQFVARDPNAGLDLSQAVNRCYRNFWLPIQHTSLAGGVNGAVLGNDISKRHS